MTYLQAAEVPAGATGYEEHTEIACPFLMTTDGAADSVILMDLPAMDAMEDEISNISLAMGGKASCYPRLLDVSKVLIH